MSQTKPDPITRLVQVCNPSEVLAPTDPRFVNFDEARGGDVVERIVRAPTRRPGCGHPGPDAYTGRE